MSEINKLINLFFSGLTNAKLAIDLAKGQKLFYIFSKEILARTGGYVNISKMISDLGIEGACRKVLGWNEVVKVKYSKYVDFNLIALIPHRYLEIEITQKVDKPIILPASTYVQIKSKRTIDAKWFIRKKGTRLCM